MNAIVSLVDRDDLLRQAATKDAMLAKGEAVGPLHGFPIAVKDLEATRGIRSTKGSPIFKDFVPEADSIMVERLRAAGAILIGKTNVPEFGLGSHTRNPVFGPTRNPYDLSRTPGGLGPRRSSASAADRGPRLDGGEATAGPPAAGPRRGSTTRTRGV